MNPPARPPDSRFLDTRVPAPIIAALLGGAMKAYRMLGEVGIDPTPLRMHLGITLAQFSALLVLAAVADVDRSLIWAMQENEPLQNLDNCSHMARDVASITAPAPSSQSDCPVA